MSRNATAAGPGLLSAIVNMRANDAITSTSQAQRADAIRYLWSIATVGFQPTAHIKSRAEDLRLIADDLPESMADVADNVAQWAAYGWETRD